MKNVPDKLNEVNNIANGGKNEKKRWIIIYKKIKKCNEKNKTKHCSEKKTKQQVLNASETKSISNIVEKD